MHIGQSTGFLIFHICNCATAWLISARCQHWDVLLCASSNLSGWYKTYRFILQQRQAPVQTQVLQRQLTCRHTCSITCAGCADGIEEQGSSIMYKANVRKILTEGEGDKLKAVGVQLADGRIYRGQVDSVTMLSLTNFCKF